MYSEVYIVSSMHIILLQLSENVHTSTCIYIYHVQEEELWMYKHTRGGLMHVQLQRTVCECSIHCVCTYVARLLQNGCGLS